MKILLSYLALTSLLLLNSCNSEDDYIHTETKVENSTSLEKKSEILNFRSKEDFLSSLENLELSTGVKSKSASSFISADDMYNNDESYDAEFISFLVPDEKYRHFLNKNLEIIVNDTIYKITKEGTFFSHINHKEELLNSIEKFSEFNNSSENIKELGNIKVINTFGLWDSSKNNPITNEAFFEDDENDISVEQDEIKYLKSASANAGGISPAEINNFPTIGTVNVSIKDKIVHFNPNYLGHTKLKFRNMKNRKLYISLYRNDYGFGVSIGIDCKVMKKLWHGMKWGRMKSWEPGIYYGLSSLVVSQKVKTPEFDNFLDKNRKNEIDRVWKESIKYNNIFDASRNIKGGFSNLWIPEYNTKNQKVPFVIPYISDFADFFNNDKIAHQIEDFLIKKGAKYLQGVVNNTHKQGVQLTFLSDREKTIYHFFKNDLSWNGGGYRVKDTFLRYYRNIVFSVKINGGDMKNPKLNLSDSDFLGSPRIESCEGLVYTRDGNGWIGAKIVK